MEGGSVSKIDSLKEVSGGNVLVGRLAFVHIKVGSAVKIGAV